MGLSCILGSPRKMYSPFFRHSAAVKERIAVPALPKNNSAFLFEKFLPSFSSASLIYLVSSLSKIPMNLLSPSAKAPISNTLLEMLFEPGTLTSPLK
ncbi:hypothetical protein R83H12_02739 [Fibrobacteria bacterium R8-3-H12]